MTKRAASTVARDHAVVCPGHGLFVDELNRGVWAGLRSKLAQVLMTNAATISPPNPPKFTFVLTVRNLTYLILHNALLEPRPAHGLLPGVLAPAPNTLVVGRLCCPQLLRCRNILLQNLVKRAFRRRGCRIGLGHVLRHFSPDRIVGLARVRRSGGEGGAQEWRRAAHADGAKSTWEHGEDLGGVSADGLRNGWWGSGTPIDDAVELPRLSFDAKEWLIQR